MGGRGGSGKSAARGGGGSGRSGANSIAVSKMAEAQAALRKTGHEWEDIDAVAQVVRTYDTSAGNTVYFSYTGTPKSGFTFTKLPSRPKTKLKRGF